jgi:hypothetical protein
MTQRANQLPGGRGATIINWTCDPATSTELALALSLPGRRVALIDGAWTARPGRTDRVGMRRHMGRAG